MAPKCNEKPKFPFREFIILPAGVVLFALLLHWVYAALISPNFDYLGYRYREPDAGFFLLSVIVAIIAAMTLPRRIDRASTFVLWLLYVVTVAPTILMAVYTPYRTDGEAVILGITVALVFGAVALGARGARQPLRWNVSPTSFWIVLFLFSALTYVLLTVTQGLNLRFLSFTDVYDVREEYSDAADSIGVIRYFVFAQAYVVNPLITARGLFTRRISWVAIGILGQLILYSGTGFKGMLFAIPAWLIVALLLRRRARKVDGNVLVWGGAALIVTSAIVDQLANTILWTSLLSRRFLATPGVFTSVYVEHFSHNPQVHLGHSILRGFVDYPYDLTPPYVIGRWMAGLPTMASNANMFADGFANFGWFGLVMSGLVLLVYLRFLDRAAAGLPVGVAGVVMTMPTLALSNSSILTAMFSHGLVAAFILLALMPRDFSPKARRESSPKLRQTTTH